MARKLNQVTEFGAKLDPTADKGINLFILNFCSIAIVFQYKLLGMNLINLITGIEIILILIAWFVKPIMTAYGFTRKLGANWLGKTKMFFESAAIITAIIVSSQWLPQLQTVLIFLANLFLVLAIILGLGSIFGHLILKNNKT